MVFSSLSFLFLFLPAFLLCYYLIKDEYKNGLLLIGSLIFYSVGEPYFLLLIITSIMINYLFGLVIEKNKQHAIRKNIFFIFSMILNLGTLIFFKYIDFIFENINLLLRLNNRSDTLPLLHLTLPLGISFYTFQIMSYVIDVYKGKIDAEHSLIDLGAYIAMFPQLIAGPIVVYSDIHASLKKRSVSIENLDRGLKVFIVGLGYKVILANRIGMLWNEICTVGFESISTPLAWIGSLAYSLQLYFDFFGYSLMAIGLGKMLGFHMPINFDHPYMSRCVSEFWRKWHMTLGAWFKEYVYIPLGGNRRGKVRMIFNLFVVWFFVGLWHGASWNFVLWGILIFVLEVIEKCFLLKLLTKEHWLSKVISHLYIVFYIMTSWTVFAITDFGQLAVYFTKLFPFVNLIYPAKMLITTNAYDFIPVLMNYGPLLLLGIIFSTTLPKHLWSKVEGKKAENGLSVGLSLGVFWYAVYFLSIGISNPFLYFRF